MIDAPLPLDKKSKPSPLIKWDHTLLDGRKNAAEIFALFRSIYAKANLNDYKMLRAIMVRDEALIRRRWGRKNPTQS